MNVHGNRDDRKGRYQWINECQETSVFETPSWSSNCPVPLPVLLTYKATCTIDCRCGRASFVLEVWRLVCGKCQALRSFFCLSVSVWDSGLMKLDSSQDLRLDIWGPSFGVGTIAATWPLGTFAVEDYCLCLHLWMYALTIPHWFSIGRKAWSGLKFVWDFPWLFWYFDLFHLIARRRWLQSVSYKKSKANDEWRLSSRMHTCLHVSAVPRKRS